VIANLYWNMVDEFGNRVLDVNEIRTRYLHLKPIDLIHTTTDESENQNKENTDPNMTITEQGKITSRNGELHSGEKEDINNLNPDKNKRN